MPKEQAEDKEKGLNEALEEIEQRFGEGAIMKLSGIKPVDVDVIPTGSLAMDYALGVMGVPRGRVIEIFGGESSGKCIKSDTIIFSESGMLPIKQFGDLTTPEFQKKEVFLYSEKGYEKSSHFYNGGVKATIKIKTNYGYELEGTPNHRIKVLDKDGNYLFRRLDQLQDTDYVAIQRNQNCFGKKIDLSDFGAKVWPEIKSKQNMSRKDFSHYKITNDIALLMGFMIGDGTCTNNGFNKNNIQITIADKEVKNKFQKLCEKLFKEKAKVTKDKRTISTERFAIHNVKARAFLYHAGVKWHKSGDKEIPWSIMCSPKKVVSYFLKALFECDGCASRGKIEYVSKSYKLVKQLQVVLLNFGIISKIKKRYNQTYKRNYYYLYIDGQRDREIFRNDIGFISKRKQDKLVNGLDKLKMFNTNVDTIPNINEKLLNFLDVYRKQVRPTRRADWDIFRDYLPLSSHHCALSYNRLKIILKKFKDAEHLSEYQELDYLFKLGFFWDKIVETRQSSAHVLDFTVPTNATFFGNGFINHNTTLSLHIIAEAQKKGGTCAFVDAEHAMDPDYAKRIGIDTKNLLISQPDSGEQALQIVEALVRSHALDVIVIDSVAALTPKAEIEGEIGDQHIGRQARLLSQALRMLTSIISKTDTLVIFLNQTRMKIGVVFGSPYTTTGGTALKFYSSVRIQLSRSAQIKKGDETIGSRVKAKIVKNKIAAPFKSVEFDIYYNEGISKEADLINMGLKHGVIKKSGSWFAYDGQKLGQGMPGSKLFLKENKKIATEIKKAVITAFTP